MNKRPYYAGLRNITEAHLEVSSQCNFKCKYCYARRTQANNLSELMPLHIAMNYLEAVFGNTSSDTVHVIFHGGEPMMQKPQWFRTIASHAYKLAKMECKGIKFEMQSNLSLMTEEYLDVISEYHISVGTSLDGPPPVNDASRAKGLKVIEGINQLKSLGCFGGVICLLGKHNYNKMQEVLHFFETENIDNISIIIGYCTPSMIDIAPLTSDEIFTALLNVYGYLRETVGNGVIERNVAGKLARFLRPPTTDDFNSILVCNNPLCGAGITINLCSSDGTVYPCGCSVYDINSQLTSIESYDDSAYIQNVKTFHSTHHKFQERCQGCEAIQICRAGCAAFCCNDLLTADSECIAVKKFYEYLKCVDFEEVYKIEKNLRDRVRV